MKERDYEALLTVYGLGSMKKPQVKRLAKWLRRMADEVEGNSKDYSTVRFYAKLMKK